MFSILNIIVLDIDLLQLNLGECIFVFVSYLYALVIYLVTFILK